MGGADIASRDNRVSHPSGNEDEDAPVSTTQSVTETRVPGGCPGQV